MIINDPSLWSDRFPGHAPDMHKYDRGCLSILAGAKMTGAARLAAIAAMRIGAGLTIVLARQKGDLYRSCLPPHIIVEDVTKDISSHISDIRRNAFLLGPGLGTDELDCETVLEFLRLKRATVLDAGALTIFEGCVSSLFDALHPACVLTPHEGEFRRLFPDIQGTREEKIAGAQKISGCTVILKGHQTLVASPGRDIAVNMIEAPSLSTAGTGDVLAGMVGALMAQGMEGYDAACAAVWLHAKAGQMFGRGLVAIDLGEMIPAILQSLDLD